MGDRFIQEINIGDLIYTYNFELECVDVCQVISLQKNWTERLATLQIGQEEIVATCGHLFWVISSQSWVRANQIETTNTLYLLDQSSVTVNDISVNALETETFNLEIDGAHTYFVGRQGILVHNENEEQASSSNFTSGERKKSSIYLVEQRVSRNPDVWKPIYAGQTIQGEGSPAVRFRQHLNEKIGWQKLKATGDIRIAKATYPDGRIAEGNWTAYERAVKELHFIRSVQNELKLRPLDPPHLETNDPKADPISENRMREYKDFQYPDGTRPKPCP